MSRGLWRSLRARLGFCTRVWEVFSKRGGEKMGNPQSSSVGLPLVAALALVAEM